MKRNHSPRHYLRYEALMGFGALHHYKVEEADKLKGGGVKEGMGSVHGRGRGGAQSLPSLHVEGSYSQILLCFTSTISKGFT
ncbi:hypothetical protein E2C01_042378 [Portunus trituberculatus]|uniref:Uncharacterized protein n=1 Tax=Portunus trituberculatus TaxID=210409 RepID=A0A5B7FLR3_PORTR|nr:hypothetical protein [Portunus trituberculatus]